MCLCYVRLRVTAYVVKVFSMAHSFISVNEKHLCGPLLYLLKNKQRPDGSFQENNPVYDTSMTVRIHNCDCTSFMIIFKRGPLSSECFLTVLVYTCFVMQGGLRGSESRVSLTAFVLIALAEAQNAVTCQEPGLDVQVTSLFNTDIKHLN